VLQHLGGFSDTKSAKHQLEPKLPLDSGYETFPFLLFRCDNLVITRQQRFERCYLFSSTAFNLINLVLSQDVDDESV
jgi:hypothetical protein